MKHHFPLKEGYMLYKQPPRKMSAKVTLKVKEVEIMIKAGLIKMARYVEWISSVVLVVKKNENMRVCIDLGF